MCAASFVSAICGFPSLSLPFAVAQLGWGAGVAAVAAVGAATALLATALVVTLVEHPKGVRHATYSALAAAHLGRGAARTVLGLQVSEERREGEGEGGVIDFWIVLIIPPSIPSVHPPLLL